MEKVFKIFLYTILIMLDKAGKYEREELYYINTFWSSIIPLEYIPLGKEDKPNTKEENASS